MSLFLIFTSVVLGFIPYAGNIISIILSAPLTCGIYIVLLGKRRGEITEFSKMFQGFRSIVPTFLVTLIITLPWIFYASMMYFVVSFKDQMGGTSGISSFPGVFESQLSPFFIISLLSVYLVLLILHVLLFFAIPLIAENNFGIVEALKLSVNGAVRNVGGIILLLILEILLSIAGVFALCIGVLLVLPVIYAANIIAYKRVFPDTKNEFFDEPPQPDYYNGMFSANT